MSEAELPLSELRRRYLASSTIGMPIAGMIVWGAIGIAALFLDDNALSLAALIGTGTVFPLSMIIDKIRGAQGISASNRTNPVTQLFMRSIFIVALIIPMVIIAGNGLKEADFIVLGLAILSGIVWIPHGWGADDPAGLTHAIVRSVGCYAAYLFTPEPIRATAICAVVVVAYVYILIAMKKPGAA